MWPDSIVWIIIVPYCKLPTSVCLTLPMQKKIYITFKACILNAFQYILCCLCALVWYSSIYIPWQTEYSLNQLKYEKRELSSWLANYNDTKIYECILWNIMRYRVINFFSTPDCCSVAYGPRMSPVTHLLSQSEHHIWRANDGIL